MSELRMWRAVLSTGEILSLPIEPVGDGMWRNAYGGPWFDTERLTAFYAIPYNRREHLVELRGHGEKTTAEQLDALRAELAP